MQKINLPRDAPGFIKMLKELNAGAKRHVRLTWPGRVPVFTPDILSCAQQQHLQCLQIYRLDKIMVEAAIVRTAPILLLAPAG